MVGIIRGTFAGLWIGKSIPIFLLFSEQAQDGTKHGAHSLSRGHRATATESWLITRSPWPTFPSIVLEGI